MSITTICPNPDCGKEFRLKDGAVGRSARCKTCSTRFRVKDGVGELLSKQSSSGLEDPEQSPVAVNDILEGLRRHLMDRGVIKKPEQVAEDAAPTDWNVGDKILDFYEVTGILGEGGMGKVYKVRHNGWNVDLAVKSPRAEILTKKHAIENFETEAETWVKLGMHPHTVSCYYVRRLGGIPRVFAEYVAGGNLKEWIESGKLYDGGHDEALKRILDIAIQFAWGLHYAHQQGLVHQDVKPTNLMMTPGGTAKVTDFGLAKARAAAGEVTAIEGQSILVSSGGMTPAYCSPEQANGEKLTRGTDIWSWAVSVLEMFTGEVTWMAGQAAAEALQDYLELGSGDESIPLMPEALAELLRVCFQRDPQKRPNTIKLASGLKEIYQRQCGESYPRSQPAAAEQMADSLNNRGVSLMDLGRRDDEAARCWEQALDLDRHHLEATYNQSLLQWRSGQLDDLDVVRRMEEVRTTHSDNQRTEELLARLHLAREDAESALTLLNEIRASESKVRSVQETLRQTKQLLDRSGRSLRTFEGHTASVTIACLSNDSRWALSGSDDQKVKLWEVDTGKCVRTFEGHESSVNCVALSVDGRWALSGSGRTIVTPFDHARDFRDMTLKLWEVDTGRCLQTFEGHQLGVTSVCFSIDGRLALSGSYDRTLKLWEVETGRCLRTIEVDSAPGAYAVPEALVGKNSASVTSACLSEDARRAVSVTLDKQVKVWDIATGKCLRTVSCGPSVCLSADGRWAFSVGGERELQLWELATGRCRCLHSMDTNDRMRAVGLSANGCWAISVGSADRLKLWETATGKWQPALEGHYHCGSCTSVFLSNDGRLALTDRAELWEFGGSLSDASFQAPYEAAHPVTSSEAMTADAEYEKAIDDTRRALLEGNFNSAASIIRQARSYPGKARRREIVDNWAALYSRLPRKDLAGGWEQESLAPPSGRIVSLCLSQNDRFALSASSDDKIQLWDVTLWKCLREFDGSGEMQFGSKCIKTGNVCSVSLSGDGRWALTGTRANQLGGRSLRDNTLKLWDVRSGECLRMFKGHDSYLTSVFLSVDGQWALSGGLDEVLKLWSTDTGNCVRTFQGHSGYVTSVCLSGDSRLALSGSWDTTLRLWLVNTGKCLRTLHGHKSKVNTVCLSVDGCALSGSDDGTLKLWDIHTGKCRQTFQGHTGAVTSVCLSGDSNWALSASADHTLKLWRVANGECVRTFQGHRTSVSSVCVSGNGRWVISGGGNLKVWFLDWTLDQHESADWDEGAMPYLNEFLSIHKPPSFLGKVFRGIAGGGRSNWREDDFQQLLYRLGCAGYGWLRPEGVRKKLEEMAADWTGPPPLPSQDTSE